MAQSLTPDTMPVALARIAKWRAGGGEPVACPLCEGDSFTIIDRSARPYAEWYVLNCAACGLDATLHVPLGPPVMGGLD